MPENNLNRPRGYEWLTKLSSIAFINFAKTKELADFKFAQFSSEFDISQGKLNVLVLLYHAGSKGMQPSNLSEQMLVSRAGVTGIIDRMEREGLVRREVHPTDRRSQIVYITTKGTELFESFLPRFETFVEASMSSFTYEELLTLTTLMAKLQRRLEEL